MGINDCIVALEILYSFFPYFHMSFYSSDLHVNVKSLVDLNVGPSLEKICTSISASTSTSISTSLNVKDKDRTEKDKCRRCYRTSH